MTTPLAYSMSGAVAASGMSRSSLERAIGAGRLKAKKSSEDEDGNPTGNWVILASALEDFLNSLADA
ncbi:hypothetical protein LRP67_16435 [Nocardioides sp. cx-169]|uniref:hypothetical protein n=1 Tax=Nocardioides sp. cx-169 TaxID=2899080 RepID=UPI001E293801|nr:hypothetical protein [Nocardioides sp. cx-169]MCD4535682.1 hypothetical protein [Nocardioides sp. cx-169]